MTHKIHQRTIPFLLGIILIFFHFVQAKVTVLGWPGGPEETALRAVTKIYNAKENTSKNDQVELIFFNREGFFDKLQADLASGTDAFDLNLLATYSIGRYAPFMTPIELSQQADKIYGESVLSTMRYNGKQYGVPMDLSLHFMYYRKDLIDALLSDSKAKTRFNQIAKKYLGKKLDPQSPEQWTWEDYAATALYFSKKINPQSPTRYGTVLQMKNLLFNIMVFHSLPRSRGGNWLDSNQRVVIDSPAFRSALKLYKMLYEAKTTPKNSFSYEYAEANAAFGSGQVAVMMQWNAAASDLMDSKKNPAIAGKVATMAPPRGSKGRFTHIHGLGLGLNKNALNPQGAKKFIQWLSSEEGATFYGLNGGAPAFKEKIAAKISSKRPDLLKLGRYASEYGFVMKGGNSAQALSVYDLQAKEFTGYWAGRQSLDQTLSKTKSGMEKLLKN